MTITANGFFKVVVLSIGTFETVVIDERHFSDRNSANEYMQTLEQGFLGVLVEM